MLWCILFRLRNIVAGGLGGGKGCNRSSLIDSDTLSIVCIAHEFLGMEVFMRSFFKIVALSVFFLMIFSASAEAEKDDLFTESYLMPPEIVQDILTRDGYYDTLQAVSPDGKYVVIPVSTYFSSLKILFLK